jgi:hypothetical protein
MSPKFKVSNGTKGVRSAQCGVREQNGRQQMADGQFVILAVRPNNLVNMFITMRTMTEGRKKICFRETKKDDF